MAQHGFARRSVFTVESSAPTHCALTLAADEATGAQFPFRFLMRAAYALEGARLTLRVTIENHDARAMPFSFGFHPALRWPLPGAANRAGHMILFERDEPRDIHILEDGYLGPARKSPAQGRAIALRDDLFAQSALVFTELASSRLRYIGPQGQSVAVGFAGMPHLGLWTKPGADFLCIEPWQGYADRADFSGDFHDKPGVVALAPGASRAFAMTLDLEERGGAFIPPV
jgi:galactose mutarotase-like enzyme